jgi:hypothetical protein
MSIFRSRYNNRTRYNTRYTGYNTNRSRYNTNKTRNKNTSKLLCDKSYLKSDKSIDIDEIKKFDLDSDTINLLNEYKNAKQEYEKKDIIIKKGFLFNTKAKCSNSNLKSNHLQNCRTKKSKIDSSYSKFMEKLKTNIIENIKKIINNVLNNPYEFKMKKFACYIKILLDLKNSSISILISRFKLANSTEIKSLAAKKYLTYLLTGVKPEDFQKYKDWFKNDSIIFGEALVNALK